MRELTDSVIDNGNDLCKDCNDPLNQHYLVGLSLLCNKPHDFFCNTNQIKYNKSYQNFVKSVANDMLPKHLHYEIEK